MSTYLTPYVFKGSYGTLTSPPCRLIIVCSFHRVQLIILLLVRHHMTATFHKQALQIVKEKNLKLFVD